jgi:hypothetical protein
MASQPPEMKVEPVDQQDDHSDQVSFLNFLRKIIDER